MDQMKSLSISNFHGKSLSATDLIEVILTLPLLESLTVDNKQVGIQRHV
jgi:hypothetical protein